MRHMMALKFNYVELLRSALLRMTPEGSRWGGHDCGRVVSRADGKLLQYFSLCYLDDFVGTEQTEQKATEAYNRSLKLTSDLGLALALEKCSPPVTTLTWFSFVTDTIKMSVTLRLAKVTEILEECALWKHKSTASKKQLQSIAGKLNHLSKSIKPARRFVNRLLSAVRTVPLLGQHKFNRDVLLDLAWFEKICTRL